MKQANSIFCKQLTDNEREQVKTEEQIYGDIKLNIKFLTPVNWDIT